MEDTMLLDIATDQKSEDGLFGESHVDQFTEGSQDGRFDSTIVEMLGGAPKVSKPSQESAKSPEILPANAGLHRNAEPGSASQLATLQEQLLHANAMQPEQPEPFIQAEQLPQRPKEKQRPFITRIMDRLHAGANVMFGKLLSSKVLTKFGEITGGRKAHTTIDSVSPRDKK